MIKLHTKLLVHVMNNFMTLKLLLSFQYYCMFSEELIMLVMYMLAQLMMPPRLNELE